MDKELESMLDAVWDLRSLFIFDWEDIYNGLYGEDQAGLGSNVERLDDPTQAGLFKKIESSRKNAGEGGYQRGYYFFTKPTFKGESKWRVVVRMVDQRMAIRLMERLVPDVVDNPKFPGVKSAKVIYNDAYEAGRKDLLIVYADDPDSMAAVVQVIQGYRSMGRFPDESFRDPLPVGIKWLARGLGTASQPPGIVVIQDTGGPSYGKYLSQVLAIAWQAAQQIKGMNLHKGDFVRVAKILLTKAGINPMYPDTIGPLSQDFVSACPFPSEEYIPLKLLATIEKQLAA
jgi:hypothetical protein